ncbi:MAG: UxaA family hydrolase [Betaproteobacteria bacterium]|nr:UxaA family hydrolase [Betaproteobacteria bacterium]
MNTARKFIRLADRDNVATLLDDLAHLERLTDGMALRPGIPFGHKVAVADIAAGKPVLKYGVVIGHATQDIPAGEHVHVHNCT